MMKFKRTAAFVISAATAFSAFGVYASADCGEYSVSGECIVSEAYSSSYKMNAGEQKTFTVSLKHTAVSDIRVTCSGKNPEIVTVTSIKSKEGGKKVAVTVKAYSKGSVSVRIYNKKTKKSVSFALNIAESGKKSNNGGSSADTYTPAPSVPAGGGEIKINVREGKPDFDCSSDKDSDKRLSADNDGEDSSSYTGSGYAQDVLDEVNRERRAYGLSPLSLDSRLCTAAQARASEISKKFSHTRPDGTDCFTIFDEYNIRYYTAAENIAYGYDTPEEVVDGWMKSPGHRANILGEDFTKLGVGFDAKTRSWVQLFMG